MRTRNYVNSPLLGNRAASEFLRERNLKEGELRILLGVDVF
jgi:hypothetical protein